jgi:hypothetical protein
MKPLKMALQKKINPILSGGENIKYLLPGK